MPESELTELDLDACAREPIHRPGSIQPHGALLVLDPESLTVIGASANAADQIGLDWAEGRKVPLADALPEGGAALAADFAAWLKGDESAYLNRVRIGGRLLHALGHRTPQAAFLEFEQAGDETEGLEGLYRQARTFLEGLSTTQHLQGALQAAAERVRAFTGFNRVLIYRFDETWNGITCAEDGDGTLPSYLHLRFPASDIPAQARELYRLNRTRLIPDADYEPSPILPAAGPDGGPLDLSFAQLRSVSPVHLEYMRNMRTHASMSISIVVEGRLWGLISCHNAEPKRVSAPVRAVCDLIGQILAMDIGARARTIHGAELLQLKSVETELLARMAREPDLAAGLTRNVDLWLNLVNADGAALVAAGGVHTVGSVPDDAAVAEVAAFVEANHAGRVFATNRLSEVMPGAARFAGLASGVIAAPISALHPSYVLWFRPEVVRTVQWAGDPTKPVSATTAGERLHPRKSFELWKGQVRGQSEPWTSAQVAEAESFRQALLSIVLRQAEERAELTGELQKSNRELEAFSYSVSHDLRAPFRHIVGFAELLQERETALDATSTRYLENIVDAALSAGRLVDDLLAFSQLGRSRLDRRPVDMRKLVAEARRSLEPDTRDRNVEWRVGALPRAEGDASMLRQVWLNLVGNAVKYTRGRDPAVIAIEGRIEGDEVVYSIEDNGVGFDMAYAAKLFGVFQRLHRIEEFEGTGIGLALCRRVIERHGGRIWAEGAVGRGATLSFALPRDRQPD